MLPVMLAARKLDSEDPKIVNLLRISYGVVQTLCLTAVLYTYYKASTSAQGSNRVIYVPPPPVVCLSKRVSGVCLLCPLILLSLSLYFLF